MNPWPVAEPVAEVHLPRPGHADLVGAQKYEHTDVRNILERASARETAARVAGGALCKAFLRALGVHGALARRADRLRPRARAPTAPLQLRGLRRGRRLARALPRRRGDPRDGRARSTGCARPTSRSAACSRCRRSGSSPASARTSPGSSASTGAWRWRSARSRRSRASRSATAFTSPACPARRRTTRSSTTTARGYYRETNRAGGLEGGMTNGQPLIVRGAMKPLPTLTKPLRSVDTATHEPAAGAARAHRLLHRPRRRRRRRGDGRARARRRLPAEVRRRPHRRRAASPCAPTASGSGGVRPDRLHGRRQVDRGAPSSPRRSASPRSTATRCWRSASVTRSPASSSCTARPRFAPPRRSSCASCCRAPGPADVIALGGGSVLLRARARARTARGGHVTVAARRRSGHRVGAGARWRPTAAESRRRTGSSARLRATSRPSRRCTPSVAGCMRELADAVLLWASSASGDYPVLVGRGLLAPPGRTGSPSVWPLDRSRSRPFCVSDETVRRCTPSGCGSSLGGPVAIAPGERHKTLAERRARLARAARRRHDPRRPRGRARGRRRRRPRRVLRRHLSSAACPSCTCPRRWSPRSTPPMAARPASTCPTPRTTSAPTTSRLACSSTPTCSRRCPPPSSPPGWVEVLKTALIAGGALWERVSAAGGCDVDERTILDCAAHQARHRRRGRARRRRPPGPEPRAHRRPRDRDRHRLRPLPPRRGGRARPARRAAAVRRRGSARAGARAAARPRSSRHARRRRLSTSRRSLPRPRATRSAWAGRRPVRATRRPGRAPASAARSPTDELRAAVAELGAS